MDDIAEDVDIQAELDKAGEVEAQQPTPEPPPEPAKAEPVVEPRADKSVPLAALLEERNKWKSEVEELKSTVAKGNERLEKLMAAFQTEQKPPEPQFEQDPLGHLKYQAEMARREAEELKNWKSQFEQARTQQEQMEVFRNQVASQEAAFASRQSDYMDAAKYVREFEQSKLEMLGLQGPQLAHALEQQMVAMAAQALRIGKNPAEVAYEYAKRAGYKPQATGNNIETLKRGAEASKTVPSGSGEPALTLEALASMNDDDFDALVDDKNWSKLRGR